MADIAIQVQNLSKCYQLGLQQERHDTLRDALTGALRRIKPGERQKTTATNTLWALHDVSFTIQRGEAVGIIGRNGAGKSTLLKILSQITEPTSGRAVINGRVGSLLEVGTGFHPELTGRENIFLYGAVLGMQRKEIERKFDEIVAFAEIERFLDTPVKRYSSGMYVRLAFAVAAHLEPEILLVDEVLAVGDASFQKKCLGKMSDVANQGRTVVFVSHNMTAIQNLCQIALWIDHGTIQLIGNSTSVVSKYLASAFTDLTEQKWDDIETAPGNNCFKLRRAAVHGANILPNEPITIRTPLILEFEYWNLKPDIYLNLSLHLYNEQGVMILNTFPMYEKYWFNKPHPIGLFCSRCFIPGDLLNDGIHRLTLRAVQNQAIPLFQIDDVLVFNIQDSPERRPDWHGKWQGSVRPILDWETELLDNLDQASELEDIGEK